jgi:hypothetical protein
MSGKFQIRLAACAENYQFIDFESSVALDLSQPIGYADRLTPSIRRGLMAGTLEDLNGEATKELQEYLANRKPKRSARSRGNESTKSESGTSAKEEEVPQEASVETEPVNENFAEEPAVEILQVEEPQEFEKFEESQEPQEQKPYTQEELEAMDVEAVKLIAQDLKVKGKDKDTMIAKILEKQNA